MAGNTVETASVENKKSIYNDLILYNSSLFKKKLVENLNILDINVEINIENILINTFSNFVKADLETVKNLSESDLYKYRKLINWDDLIATIEISEELFINVLDELDLFTIISYFSTAKCSNDFIDVCFTLINDDINFIESGEKMLFTYMRINIGDFENMYKSVITNIIKNNFNSDLFSKYYNSNIILLNHEVILSNNIIDENLIYNKISEELNNNDNLEPFIKSVIKYQPVSKKIFNLLMKSQFAELYLLEYIKTGLIDLNFLSDLLNDIKSYPYLNLNSVLKIILNNLSLTLEERIIFCSNYKIFINDINSDIFKNELVTGKFYLKNKYYNLKNSGIIDYLFLDNDTKNKIITKAINQYTGDELQNKLQNFYEYNLDFTLYVKYVLNEETKQYENVYYKDKAGVNDKFEFPTFTIDDYIEYFDYYFASTSYLLNNSVEEKDFTEICNILNEKYNFKKLEFFKQEFSELQHSGIFKNFYFNDKDLIVPPLDYCYKIVNNDYSAQTRPNLTYKIGDVITCNYLYSGLYGGSTLKSIERFYEPKSKTLKCIYNKNFAKNNEFIITHKINVIEELNNNDIK